jgi:hypothetical protein
MLQPWLPQSQSGAEEFPCCGASLIISIFGEISCIIPPCLRDICLENLQFIIYCPRVKGVYNALHCIVWEVALFSDILK